MGFQVTSDFGKYLGVPIHHKRVTRDSYMELVEKVQRRLAGWKSQSLSLAGRTTLVSSVTSSIPGYTMQMANLPAYTCETMEKRNRNFLWGSTQEKRKAHLVNWETVCRGKKKGVLGLRHLKEQNQAYMMKLGWQLVTRRDAMWVKVMRSKYRCGNDLFPMIDMERTGSNTWVGLKSSWEKVKDGCLVDNVNHSVKWRHNKDEMFTLRSAYDVLTEPQGDENRIWQSIWKVNTIQRCRMFLWLALHGKLLTNVVRQERQMCEDNRCTWCKQKPETLLHVLRDCDETRKLWLQLIPRNKHQQFFRYDLKDWLTMNILNRGEMIQGEWSGLFSTICWSLWSRRNGRIFENKILTNDAVILKSQQIVDILNQSRTRLKGVNLNGNRIVDRGEVWSIPAQGWYKVNIDGAMSASQRGGCGGVIRSDTGEFITGFFFPINECDSLYTELRAMLHGLKIAWEKGLHKIILESDSLEAVNRIQQTEGGNSQGLIVITDIVHMLNQDWRVQITHIPREANRVADFLAKQAIDTEPGFHIMNSPSAKVRRLLLQDLGSANAG